MFRHVCSIGLLVLTGQVVYYNLSQPETTFDTICNVLPRFDVIAYGFGISLVMLFLWFRQTTFFVCSHFKIIHFKIWKIFSYLALFLLIFLCIDVFKWYMMKVNIDISKAIAWPKWIGTRIFLI